MKKLTLLRRTLIALGPLSPRTISPFCLPTACDHWLGVALSAGALLLSTACGGERLPEGATAAEIRGGEVDRGHPNVGLLHAGNGTFCSGTLIAPNVVLTAAHCLKSTLEGFYLGTNRPQRRLSVSGMRRFAVTEQKAHRYFSAGWVVGSGCHDTIADVAIVHLRESVMDVKPASISAEAPAVGSACVAVGYGGHYDDTLQRLVYGQKRRADVIVERVDEGQIAARWGNGISEQGDSGGPLLRADKMVGITSCKTGGPATQRSQYFTRVSRYADWIRRNMAPWLEIGSDPAPKMK